MQTPADFHTQTKDNKEFLLVSGELNHEEAGQLPLGLGTSGRWTGAGRPVPGRQRLPHTRGTPLIPALRLQEVGFLLDIVVDYLSLSFRHYDRLSIKAYP